MKRTLILFLVSTFLYVGQAYAQFQLKQGRILFDIDSALSTSTTALSQILGPGAEERFQKSGTAYTTNFPYTHPRVFRLSVEKTHLSFSLFPKHESTAQTNIAVSYPSGLYSLFLRSSAFSRLSQSEVIKGTVCRSKQPFCTGTSAQVWQKGVYGAGYQVKGDHKATDFTTPAHFRSFSSSSDSPFVSNTLNTPYIKPTSVYSSSLTIAVKLSENQPRGTYIGVIEIIGMAHY